MLILFVKMFCASDLRVRPFPAHVLLGQDCLLLPLPRSTADQEGVDAKEQHGRAAGGERGLWDRWDEAWDGHCTVKK